MNGLGPFVSLRSLSHPDDRHDRLVRVLLIPRDGYTAASTAIGHIGTDSVGSELNDSVRCSQARAVCNLNLSFS